MLLKHSGITLGLVTRLTVALILTQDDGSDLLSYVSRPDIRAPRMTTTTYDQVTVSPGYIFTAPYHRMNRGVTSDSFIPGQIGPHIYNQQGDLIWSGATLLGNRVTTDFKMAVINGSSHLTLQVHEHKKHGAATGNLEWIDVRAAAMVFDSSYEIVQEIDISQDYDPHEFLALDESTSFLKTFSRIVQTNKILPGESINIVDTCFGELDSDGSVTVKFCPWEKLGPNETMHVRLTDEIFRKYDYDLFHMNSIDKFSGGDYLTSIRYTNAVYKVSGSTGDVIWRLGGKFSDFEQDFSFSGQHDARIISCNETVTIISLLDNASANKEQIPTTSTVSSFKIVAMYENETPRRAVLLKQFDRPDGELSRLRGNGQYLSNGAAFVGWSKNGYATEFSHDGRLLQEVQFVSGRYDSYRIFKYDFVGSPSDPPDLRTFAINKIKGETMLVSYVSWNGATRVASWEVFGCDHYYGDFQSLGEVNKTGFETSFIINRSFAYTFVQAKDSQGFILGQSETVETEHQGAAGANTLEPQLAVPSDLTPTVSVTARMASVFLCFEFFAIFSILCTILVAVARGGSIKSQIIPLYRRLLWGRSRALEPSHAIDQQLERELHVSNESGANDNGQGRRSIQWRDGKPEAKQAGESTHFRQRFESDDFSVIHNSTLGFQKILVISLPDRLDTRDVWSVASVAGNLDIEYVEGIRGEDISQKARPARWSSKAHNSILGSFRSHLNAIRRILDERLSTALILEDDAEWDVMLRQQLIQFAHGARYVQDHRGHPSSCLNSVYGRDWDVLLLGHCGARSRPDIDGRYWFAHNDPTVMPQSQFKWVIDALIPDMSAPELQSTNNFTRVIYEPASTRCTYGYAMSLRGAQRFLYHFSLEPNAQMMDYAINEFCSLNLYGAKCITAFPQLIDQYRAAGPTIKDTERIQSQQVGDLASRQHAIAQNIVFPFKAGLQSYIDGSSTYESQWPGDSLWPRIDPARDVIPLGKGISLEKDRFRGYASPPELKPKVMD